MVSNIGNATVDLHLHTDYSDGTCNPSEVLDLCMDKGLQVISITDHDTVEGVEESIQGARKRNLGIIPGIEISSKYPPGTLHILGYGIDYRDRFFLSELERFQLIRKNRNIRIIDKLKSLGIDIEMSEVVLEKSKAGSLGRPHIAMVMLKKGIVDSIGEAFDEYLGKSGKAFVSKEVLTSAETIKLIHDVGGFAFLAHPSTLNLESSDFRDYIKKLISEGLDGMEIYSSAHTAEQIGDYCQVAGDFDLMVSAGSDFHGKNKKDVFLGISNVTEMVRSDMISGKLLDLAVS